MEEWKIGRLEIKLSLTFLLPGMEGSGNPRGQTELR
jgi:hypothetical protein